MKQARFILLALLALILPLSVGAEPIAGVQSGWATGAHARARLVFAEWQEGSRALLGVEIALEPGWHTYWRDPGEAGVPPRFDFSASSDARLVRVSYPEPKAFTDNGYKTQGYDGHVIFPVEVEAGEGAMVRLTLDYAVCAEICMIDQAVLSLPLVRFLSGSPHREAVRASQALSAAP